MKKLRTETVILGVLIVALGLYLFLRQDDRTGYRLPDLPRFDKGTVNRLEIARPGETLQLVQQGGRWQIDPQGYPADGDRVGELLDTLRDLTLTALASESGNLAQYELDDGQRIAVKAWQNDQPVRELAIGKAAASFRHTFVALPDDVRVYQAQDNFRARFDVGANELRDKVVLSFERGTIQQVTSRRGTAEVTLNRQLGAPVGGEEGAAAGPLGWVDPSGRPADNDRVDRLLGALAALRCDAFIDDRDKGDFHDPIHRIVLRGIKEYTLQIFARPGDDGDYPALSSECEYPFLLPAWRADELMADPAKLVAGEPNG